MKKHIIKIFTFFFTCQASKQASKQQINDRLFLINIIPHEMITSEKKQTLGDT
jgi:hypothetical protein